MISREHAKEVLENLVNNEVLKSVLLRIDIEAMKCAISALSENKGEYKHGYWICHKEVFNAFGVAVSGVKCSECGYTTHNKLHVEIGCPFKFCPNCGADMKRVTITPVDKAESEDK